MAIQIQLPDGSRRELADGATAYDLAAAIGPGLAKAAMAAAVNDRVRDLRFPLADGDTVRLLTKKDAESLDVLRHSAAHVLAQAVQNLFPGTKIATGPNIENGFYYDLDVPGHQLTPDDFKKIEDEMARIAKEGQVFERRYIEDVDARLAEFEDRLRVVPTARATVQDIVRALEIAGREGGVQIISVRIDYSENQKVFGDASSAAS